MCFHAPCGPVRKHGRGANLATCISQHVIKTVRNTNPTQHHKQLPKCTALKSQRTSTHESIHDIVLGCTGVLTSHCHSRKGKLHTTASRPGPCASIKDYWHRLAQSVVLYRSISCTDYRIHSSRLRLAPLPYDSFDAI